MAYRIFKLNGGGLNGYVNWTLTSFTIADYNLTNTVPQYKPLWNSTCCR